MRVLLGGYAKGHVECIHIFSAHVERNKLRLHTRNWSDSTVCVQFDASFGVVLNAADDLSHLDQRNEPNWQNQCRFIMFACCFAGGNSKAEVVSLELSLDEQMAAVHNIAPCIHR